MVPYDLYDAFIESGEPGLSDREAQSLLRLAISSMSPGERALLRGEYVN